MFIEKVCVASDGSDVAVRAAQIAVLAAHSGARRMVAVSVAQPQFSLAQGSVLRGSLESAANQALEAARAHVDTVARIARSGGVACEVLIKLASSPGPEIVRTAEEYACDLIVMGSHGPSAIDRGYAGSVAQYVMAASKLPVLVLRDPREALPPDYSDVLAP